MRSLLGEPMVHFFVIGAVLLIGHRLVAGDSRTIVVSGGVKAGLERRFVDQNGRPPTPPELANAVETWKRDEALYREALSEHLDRDDPAVRTALADKMRALAALEIKKREPSEAELDRFFATHKRQYELPTRYDYEAIVFSKTDPAAAKEREDYERALSGGQDARTLGRPIIGGVLAAAELDQRFGAALGERVRGLPIGHFERLESDKALLLVRLNRVEGGLPSREALHARLVADWTFAEEQRAIDRAVQRIVERYRFEERP